jgi:hypothetical protein
MKMHTLGDLLATISFINLGLFVVFYAAFSPWWRSPSGRSVMALVAVLAATFGLVVTGLWFGVQWPARELIRVVIFGAVALASGHLLAVNVRQKIAVWRTNWQEKKTPEGSETCDSSSNQSPG